MAAILSQPQCVYWISTIDDTYMNMEKKIQATLDTQCIIKSLRPSDAYIDGLA